MNVKVYNFIMTKQEFEAIIASARLDRTNDDMYDTVNQSILAIVAALGCNNEQL